MGQPAETVARVLVFAGRQERGSDLGVEAPEPLVLVRHQDLLQPVHPVRFQFLCQLDRVGFRQRHPAVDHDLAVRAHQLARPLDVLDVLLQAFATVGRAVLECQLDLRIAEFEALLDVVPGGVAGNALPSPAADQLVDGDAECLAH